jgi:hypothetical protein
MTTNRRSTFRAALMMALMLIITIASSRLRADSGSCGGATVTLPFTDVMGNPFFCEIAEAFFSGLTNGTSATTYSPGANVPREQMAAFITRTMDQSLKRGSRRAALKQFWAPTSEDGLGLTTVGSGPESVASDGADLWVANNISGTVSRVRGSDGKVLETWTGATSAVGVLAAKGLIFVTGETNPGSLYQIDPTQPAGAVTTLTSSLGTFPRGIAFDGARIWTAAGGGVSIVTLNPLSVTTITTGFHGPVGILYDGANMWVTEMGVIPGSPVKLDSNGAIIQAGGTVGSDPQVPLFPGNLLKLNSNGAIIQSVTVRDGPQFPVFDGTNIWAPNRVSSEITVVRASTGAVIATLSGNGLVNPVSAAFDGERILITNFTGQSVSLWKAADLSPLGSVDTGPGTQPFGACSDGLNFWITLSFADKLARF